MMHHSPGKPLQHPDAYWRTMRYFGAYRLVLAGILFGTYFFVREREWWQDHDSLLYFRTTLGYLLFGIVIAGMAIARWPRFNRQLTLQTAGDIFFIVILIYASGGVKSGLGLLLVVAVAGASLISQGRLAIFYAALASIALLLEQSWRVLVSAGRFEDFTHVAMLALSCFATAWLAHSFANRTRQSEELASRRGIDLENLAQINQLVIGDMQDGIMVIDGDLRVRHHNTRAELLLGTADTDWKETTLDRFAPEIARLHSEWVQGKSENAASDFHISMDGRELRLRFVPVSADRTRGTVIFIEDWSRVQGQARQLKLAALGRLTANIAHEIRNPLSAISHANQLLQEEQNDDPTFRRLLQIIDDNVIRLDHMVNDVMQLSRRDRSRQESILLEDFLHEFREQFCQIEKIDTDGFVLNVECPAATIMFDRNHLHQVLWNLCRNAWRHGRKKAGSLQLMLRENARTTDFELEVGDDGPGVPPEIRANLFEPFFTTQADGTGLGLYVARELCEANGARLAYVESAGGACFRIFLKGQYA
jgi:two-component system sensor histidine kinase PilS (NtrC family)